MTIFPSCSAPCCCSSGWSRIRRFATAHDPEKLQTFRTRSCAEYKKGPAQADGPPSACRRELLGDLALEIERPRRQFDIARLGEEGVEAAAVIDAPQRIGGDPKPHRAAERIGNHGDIQEVRQEAPLG